MNFSTSSDRGLWGLASDLRDYAAKLGASCEAAADLRGLGQLILDRMELIKCLIVVALVEHDRRMSVFIAGCPSSRRHHR
ncbi:MAG: hypothetical protein KGI75_06335 [Rhizobiaceae bacterium]|nr:hypothetical protein [Rhizobiaceae bacterium]